MQALPIFRTHHFLISSGLILTLSFSSVFSQSVVNTKQLAASLPKLLEYRKAAAALEADGQSIRADEVNTQIRQLRFELFKPGKTYVTTPDCPVFSWYSGGYNGISLTCWPADIKEELREKASTENEFHILLKSDYALRMGWNKKTKLKAITADKIAGKLQEKGYFKAKFQIIDNNMRGEFLIKVLSAERAEYQAPEAPPTPPEVPE